MNKLEARGRDREEMSRGYMQFRGRSCVRTVPRAASRGEDVKCGRIAGREREIDEKRGRGKKLNPRDFIGAPCPPPPRSVSVGLLASGAADGKRGEAENCGKRLFRGESESNGRAMSNRN